MDGSDLGFVVVIPTLCRYDLLGECLRSVAASEVKPSEVCVVDNGGGFEPEPGVAERCALRVVRPGRNLGVGASWNLGHRLYAPRDVVLVNDDLTFDPEVLGRLVGSPHGIASAVTEPRDWWSFFLQREAVWERVGEYDEGFWPGYYEDNDYYRRIRLAGIEHGVVSVPTGAIRHRVSSTGGVAFTLFEWNGWRYVQKWGGGPDGERFDRPFNGQPETELDLFQRFSCTEPSNGRGHCAALSELARGSGHVTRVGGWGLSPAVALLHARPRRFVEHNAATPPEFDYLDLLARGAGIERVFHHDDSLAAPIEPTDVLMLDTIPSDDYVARLLDLHAPRVRRRIAVHAWPGPHEAPGPRPVVAEFLGRHPGWGVLADYPHENGMTVLARDDPGFVS
jgi:hypothetical protein